MNSRDNFFFAIDWGLLAPSLILVALSLTTLASVNLILFKSQLIYFFISISIFLLFCQINYRVLEFYTLPIYLFSVIILLFVLVIGIESRGAVRWFDILGLRIQFSEILKPFLAISFSSFLSQRSQSIETFGIVFLLAFPIVLLIALQPDLGNSIVYLLSMILTLVIVGFSLAWFSIGVLGIAILSPILWKFMHEYQKQRIISFIHPSNDPLGLSYNAIQAVIAVGSGGFLGKGLGEGTQSSLFFLPERHTDFIFATLSEGLGLLGASLVIIAFAFLLYRIYVIFSESDDLFIRIFTSISFVLILFQMFVNIGMNIGIIPIVGIALPFVSYGGSSLLSNFILLGMLSSVARVGKDRGVLEIK